MVVEIFSSIQGEGLHLGRRQIFIRLADCNLACAYCDTEFFRASIFPCEIRPGCGFSTDMPNPVASYEIAELVAGWKRDLPGAHHSISITGGEPLCQADALAVWLPELRKILPVHLETNGTLPDALAPLLSEIDFISMDIKLASVTGVPTPWEEHRRFLAPGGAVLLVRSSWSSGRRRQSMNSLALYVLLMRLPRTCRLSCSRRRLSDASASPPINCCRCRPSLRPFMPIFVSSRRSTTFSMPPELEELPRC